jgi:hypothetical protein
MSIQHPVRESEDESDALTGMLFRLGSRLGVIVAAGVFLLALTNGLEPTEGLVRASFALLAFAGLAWVAEQIVRSAPAEQPAPEPEVKVVTEEPEHEESQQAA